MKATMSAIINTHPVFSREMNAWCIYQSTDGPTMHFLWKCKNENAANRLANELNAGAPICGGCKKLGNACGKCIKCELTV